MKSFGLSWEGSTQVDACVGLCTVSMFHVNWLCASRIRPMNWWRRCQTATSTVDKPRIWTCFGMTRVDRKFDQGLWYVAGCMELCNFHVNWLLVSWIQFTHWQRNDAVNINQCVCVCVCVWYAHKLTDWLYLTTHQFKQWVNNCEMTHSLCWRRHFSVTSDADTRRFRCLQTFVTLHH